MWYLVVAAFFMVLWAWVAIGSMANEKESHPAITAIITIAFGLLWPLTPFIFYILYQIGKDESGTK